MNRGLFSALSALTLATGTVAYYFWRQINTNSPLLLDRLLIKKVLIRLRKRAYSTLREISFIVNHIRTLQGDLQVKKISEIFMRDGGSGQKKLRAIEALVLKQQQIDQKDFEHSCGHYCQHDIQIKMLLQTFRKDLNMALEGVIQSYHGPLPRFEPQRVIKIQEQIIRRRMQIIQRKYCDQIEDEECFRLEACMQPFVQVASQQYLAEQGITHDKQPHQKLFMGILEQHYRHDALFKEQFEQLELEMEMFMIDIQNKCRKGHRLHMSHNQAQRDRLNMDHSHGEREVSHCVSQRQSQERNKIQERYSRQVEKSQIQEEQL